MHLMTKSNLLFTFVIKDLITPNVWEDLPLWSPLPPFLVSIFMMAQCVRHTRCLKKYQIYRSVEVRARDFQSPWKMTPNVVSMERKTSQ
jgi:hypothetical protein